MLTDAEIKKKFKEEASKNPDKYYATEVLREEGFHRARCKKCGTFFWSTTERNLCGDARCIGGYTFIGKSPAKNKLDYIGTWKLFSKMFRKFGYTPIKRYPVVARWRDDVDFVQASIYDFQPYVVSGEVQPPANPLVVPQFCLRFNDTDNVGITGAHYTGFVMIGQHAFVQPEQWNQNAYFRHIYAWLRKGLKLGKEHIIFHEDVWAGGGNFGPCMEFFSGGLELGNQVYMLFERTPTGKKELSLRVLDMGMGHERNAWFSQGSLTSYDTAFPKVCKKLRKVVGIKMDKDYLKAFYPYAALLNIDELKNAKNVDAAWAMVAKKLGLDAKELKETLLPIAALYSIAEHARALLVALSDGILPSNVGGGYNLRAIFRRAQSFIEQYGWSVEMGEVAEWHASYLKPLFPELMEGIEHVKHIIAIERNKYAATKQKTTKLVERVIKKKITEEMLLKLYDSYGIAPELIATEAAKHGLKVRIPENFYAKIAEMHEKVAVKKIEKPMIDIKGIAETEILYYDDYALTEFDATVLKVLDNLVALDKTAFYPTSGGQEHDTGTLNGVEVVDVLKVGPVILHRVRTPEAFKPGMKVHGKIDFDRRKQLTQHHTATHIINAAAKAILGPHVNQAGAKKDIDKAHLDITHYQSITPRELKMIEAEANRIVNEGINIYSRLVARNKAEAAYGMSIYQGGAVPGKILRIVEIPGIDVEACGGTHLKNTKDVGLIKVIKSSKIADGICRIVFAAGNAALAIVRKERDLLAQTARILGVDEELVPSRTEELFKLWKAARKAVSKLRNKDFVSRLKKGEIKLEFELKSRQRSKASAAELLEQAAANFKTQPEYVPKTAKRFLRELKEFEKRIREVLH